MKYYQYISDAKVDMLLPQIPLKVKQKISSEVGFDIKLLSGKLKTQRVSLEDRVSRLEAVVDHLRTTEQIGSISTPASWLQGTHEVRVGYFESSKKVIGFIGSTNSIEFLLAGSSGHVIGAEPNDATIGHGYSFTPRLLDYLESAFGYFRDGVMTDAQLSSYLGEQDTKRRNWDQLIGDAVRRLSGPTSKVEFLAKRLLITGSQGAFRILGTPLYVALLD